MLLPKTKTEAISKNPNTPKKMPHLSTIRILSINAGITRLTQTAATAIINCRTAMEKSSRVSITNPTMSR